MTTSLPRILDNRPRVVFRSVALISFIRHTNRKFHTISLSSSPSISVKSKIRKLSTNILNQGCITWMHRTQKNMTLSRQQHNYDFKINYTRPTTLKRNHSSTLTINRIYLVGIHQYSPLYLCQFSQIKYLA